MTISIAMRWDEGPLSASSASANGSILYVATSDDPANDGRDDVISYLIANAPATLFGLIMDEVSVNERITETTDEAIWDCEVKYKSGSTRQPFPLYATPGQVRPVRTSVNSAGGTSLQMIESKEFIAESTAENVGWFKFGAAQATERLLGFESNTDKDAASNFTVKGVPVSLYTVELKIETVATSAEITAGYVVNMTGYAGRNVINIANWRGWPLRSLKFTGFSATQRADTSQKDPSTNQELWDLELTFAFAPWEAIQYPTILFPPIKEDVGGVEQDRPKKGHELLDVLYIEDVVEVNGVKVAFQNPVRIALHRINDEVNFDTDLGLGSIM